MLETGIKGNVEDVVTDALSAKTLGSGTMDVLGTPGLAALAEKCAWQSVVSYLGEGEGTVGIRLDLKHLSATPVGRKVRLSSELTQIDGRRLVFSFEAFDEAGKIGEGIHERFVVNKKRFFDKACSKYEIDK